MAEKLLLEILDEIKVMKGEINGIKDEQIKTNKRLDGTNQRLNEMDRQFNERFDRLENKTNAIQEQTAKISEYHMETMQKLNSKATKDDFNYLKEMVFKHDEEIYKIKSQYQSINEN
ncbi:hypothetical protein [Gracilibacillus thailandensis]|uniref:Uncharacterized protein n=1 Tax=Gracilibacillus thailandensis TaxID=563735 RepID=A0A6N7R3E0_9BACI|nr:hypothetical protein [Gracilibacillus thailandensis]MRI67446.1 hypothetical protein [Gracilibacillus thailandensis]